MTARIGLGILACALSLSGQAPPLTLDQAVRFALDRNPAAQSARESIREAQARVKQARAAFYPQFGFSGLAKAGLSGSLNGLSPVGIANSPFFDNFATGINAYHPGFDFGRTRHNVDVVRFRGQALESDLAAVEAKVVLDVRRAYFEALRAAELEIVAERGVASRRSNAQRAEAFHEAELRSKLDWDLARVLLAEGQVERIQARNRRLAAHAALARALGDESAPAEYDLETPGYVAPDLEPLADLAAEARSNRPEILAVERRLWAAESAAELARARRKPMMSFFSTGAWARTTPRIISRLAAVGTGLAFPLLSFGRLGGAVEEAEAHVEFLRNRREDLRQQATFETRIAYLAVQNALEVLPVREFQETVAREARELAGIRYEEQLGDIVELNEAESRLAEAEAGRAAAAFEVQRAEAELRYAVGRR